MNKIHGFCKHFRPDNTDDTEAEPRCQLGNNVSQKGEDVCSNWVNKTWDDITSIQEVVMM